MRDGSADVSIKAERCVKFADTPPQVLQYYATQPAIYSCRSLVTILSCGSSRRDNLFGLCDGFLSSSINQMDSKPSQISTSEESPIGTIKSQVQHQHFNSNPSSSQNSSNKNPNFYPTSYYSGLLQHDGTATIDSRPVRKRFVDYLNHEKFRNLRANLTQLVNSNRQNAWNYHGVLRNGYIESIPSTLRGEWRHDIEELSKLLATSTDGSDNLEMARHVAECLDQFNTGLDKVLQARQLLESSQHLLPNDRNAMIRVLNQALQNGRKRLNTSSEFPLDEARNPMCSTGQHKSSSMRDTPNHSNDQQTAEIDPAAFLQQHGPQLLAILQQNMAKQN